MKVGQAKKGAYFAEIKPEDMNLEAGTVAYDTWSEMYLNEAKIDNVEMEFEVMPIGRKIQVGNLTDDSKNIIPFISGINDNEKMRRGEVRTINISRIKLINEFGLISITFDIAKGHGILIHIGQIIFGSAVPSNQSGGIPLISGTLNF